MDSEYRVVLKLCQRVVPYSTAYHRQTQIQCLLLLHIGHQIYDEPIRMTNYRMQNKYWRRAILYTKGKSLMATFLAFEYYDRCFSPILSPKWCFCLGRVEETGHKERSHCLGWVYSALTHGRMSSCTAKVINIWKNAMASQFSSGRTTNWSCGS